MLLWLVAIAFFLQSLDADQDHTNGIEISQATVDALADKTIDFTLPTESFEEDATLALAIEAAGTELVSEQDAKNNFFDSFLKDHTGAWLLEDQATGTKTVLYIDGTTSGEDDEKAFHNEQVHRHKKDSTSHSIDDAQPCPLGWRTAGPYHPLHNVRSLHSV